MRKPQLKTSHIKANKGIDINPQSPKSIINNLYVKSTKFDPLTNTIADFSYKYLRNNKNEFQNVNTQEEEIDLKELCHRRKAQYKIYRDLSEQLLFANQVQKINNQADTSYIGGVLWTKIRNSVNVFTNISERINQIQKKNLPDLRKRFEQIKNIISIQGFKPKLPKEVIGLNQDYSNTASFFQGDTLHGEDDYRMSLYQGLRPLFNHPFSYTRLLFRYDPLNTTNIHSYVDNHPHIVLLARLENGTHIAAYSELGFNSRMMKKGQGILFSLTNRRSYPVKSGKSSIIYDENYLIFGNTELRISSHDNRLYSNFGTNSGYFQTNGDKIQNFIGTSQRQITFQNLEIFQLLFDQ